MSDYEYEKPAPIKLDVMSQTGQPIELLYSFEAYLGEYIWSFPKWNEDDGWADAQIRIGDMIEQTPPGGKYRLSLADTEKFREANKAARISGQNAPRLRKLQRSIRCAEHAQPEAH